MMAKCPRSSRCCASSYARRFAGAMAWRSCRWRLWASCSPSGCRCFRKAVFRFFERVFQLDDWARIVVANDLTGLWFFIYWIAVFDVLTIYVVPLEERRLDLYLSKPLSRRAYMVARLVPVLLTSIGIYTASVGVCWLTLRMAQLAYPAAAFIGAAGAVLAWTLTLVALVNLAALWTRESYAALLCAFILMALAILPSTFYMYRPDIFTDAPKVRDLIVFPLNLIWYPDFAANLGIGGLRRYC